MTRGHVFNIMTHIHIPNLVTHIQHYLILPVTTQHLMHCGEGCQSSHRHHNNHLQLYLHLHLYSHLHHQLPAQNTVACHLLLLAIIINVMHNREQSHPHLHVVHQLDKLPIQKR